MGQPHLHPPMLPPAGGRIAHLAVKGAPGPRRRGGLPDMAHLHRTRAQWACSRQRVPARTRDEGLLRDAGGERLAGKASKAVKQHMQGRQRASWGQLLSQAPGTCLRTLAAHHAQGPLPHVPMYGACPPQQLPAQHTQTCTSTNHLPASPTTPLSLPPFTRHRPGPLLLGAPPPLGPCLSHPPSILQRHIERHRVRLQRRKGGAAHSEPCRKEQCRAQAHCAACQQALAAARLRRCCRRRRWCCRSGRGSRRRGRGCPRLLHHLRLRLLALCCPAHHTEAAHWPTGCRAAAGGGSPRARCQRRAGGKGKGHDRQRAVQARDRRGECSSGRHHCW